MRYFIVTDIEGLMINCIHHPYVAGFMVVRPGKEVPNVYNITFADSDATLKPDFLDRSEMMMTSFMNKIDEVVEGSAGLRTIILHNLGRFDGIFILKHCLKNKNKYKVQTLIQNHQIYEIDVEVGGNYPQAH